MHCVRGQRGYRAGCSGSSSIGALPSDSDELRARKAVLVLSSTLMAALACVWVVTYAVLGLWVSAAIPLVVPGRHGDQHLHVRANAPLHPVPRKPARSASAVAVRAAMEPGRFRELFGSVPLGDHLADGRAACSWARVRPSPGSWRSSASSCSLPRSTLPSLLVRRTSRRASSSRSLRSTSSALATTVFAVLQYFVRARERALMDLAQQHQALELEQAKSERLLLNVLPESVAARLKEHDGSHRRRLPRGHRAVRGHRRLHAAVRATLRVGAGVAAGRGVRALGRAGRRARGGEDQDDR